MSTEPKITSIALTNLVFVSASPVYRDLVAVARSKRELPQLVLNLLDLYATSVEFRAEVSNLIVNTNVNSLAVKGSSVVRFQLTLYKIPPELLGFIHEFQERHLLSTLIGTLLKLFYHFKPFGTAVLVASIQKEPTASRFRMPAPILSWVEYVDALDVPSIGRETVSNDFQLAIRADQGKSCVLGSVRVVRGSNFVKGSVLYALDKDMNRLEPIDFYGSGKPLYFVPDVYYLVKQDQIIREGEGKGKVSIFLPIGLSPDNKLIFRDISILYWGDKYAELYVKNLKFVRTQLVAAGMCFLEPQIVEILD